MSKERREGSQAALSTQGAREGGRWADTGKGNVVHLYAMVSSWLALLLYCYCSQHSHDGCTWLHVCCRKPSTTQQHSQQFGPYHLEHVHMA
jgi:hypothetical protein